MSLPPSVSLHHTLCPYVSDPSHPNLFNEKSQQVSQGVGEERSEFQGGPSKEAANKVLWLLYFTFSDVGELQVILLISAPFSIFLICKCLL